MSNRRVRVHDSRFSARRAGNVSKLPLAISRSDSAFKTPPIELRKRGRVRRVRPSRVEGVLVAADVPLGADALDDLADHPLLAVLLHRGEAGHERLALLGRDLVLAGDLDTLLGFRGHLLV